MDTFSNLHLSHVFLKGRRLQRFSLEQEFIDSIYAPLFDTHAAQHIIITRKFNSKSTYNTSTVLECFLGPEMLLINRKHHLTKQPQKPLASTSSVTVDGPGRNALN